MTTMRSIIMMLVSLLPSYWTLVSARTIIEELRRNDASTVANLIERAGLQEALTTSAPFTFFAPINAAFEKLPSDLVRTLTQDVSLLRTVLLGHIVPGQTVYYPVTKTDQLVDSAAGPGVAKLRINAYKRRRFSGGYLTVNGKRVSKANIVPTDVDGVVIHTITEVLYPQVRANDTAPNVLISDGRFTILLSALQQAGLVGALSSDGTFTIFAPTDNAFKELGDDVIRTLLRPENREKLAMILKRHVIANPPTLFSSGISWSYHETLSGESIYTMKLMGGGVRVVFHGGKRATVIDPDLISSNGVIHAIDQVL